MNFHSRLSQIGSLVFSEHSEENLDEIDELNEAPAWYKGGLKVQRRQAKNDLQHCVRKSHAHTGKKITQLTPSRGFAAELAAATTIVIASGTGIPISTTHTLVGAVLGVGIARGIEAIDLRVVGRILVSWVVTIPAGAILAILFFFIFKTVLP